MNNSNGLQMPQVEINRKDKIVKEVADDSGRLMFLLETYIKLYQTKDHPELAFTVLKEIRADIVCLSASVEELYMEGGPTNE